MQLSEIKQFSKLTAPSSIFRTYKYQLKLKTAIFKTIPNDSVFSTLPDSAVINGNVNFKSQNKNLKNPEENLKFEKGKENTRIFF